MLKIDKRLTITVHKGTVTERMADLIQESETGRHGFSGERLRTWSIVGFLLEELGNGVMDAWLAMERNGELEGMSKAERADKLSGFLRNVSGLSPVQNKHQYDVIVSSDEVEVKKKPDKPKRVSIGSLANIPAGAA